MLLLWLNSRECGRNLTTNFDGKLSDIFATCLCPTFMVNGLILFSLCVRSWLGCCSWITKSEGSIAPLNLLVNTTCWSYIPPLIFGDWLWDSPKGFIGNVVTNRKLNNIFVDSYFSKSLNGVSVEYRNFTAWNQVQANMAVKLLELLLLGSAGMVYRCVIHSVGRRVYFLVLRWGF